MRGGWILDGRSRIWQWQSRPTTSRADVYNTVSVEKKEYKHSNTCASGMLCSQEHGHASTFNMLTEMHKATWGLFPRTVCKAVHPYCRRREGRREAEMDYLVGQHAEVWSDMPWSQLLSRKCKSKLNSCSFSILVCIHVFFTWCEEVKKKKTYKSFLTLIQAPTYSAHTVKYFSLWKPEFLFNQ